MIYNYNTPSQFQEVVRILEQRKVVCYVGHKFRASLQPLFFPDRQYPPPGGFIIEPYLESHYKIVQIVDGTQIMERKSDELC